MAVFTVTNLDDSGAGSLRNAVAQAEALAGPDQINFQAGLSGVLRLTSGRLTVTTELTINGDTNGDGLADIVLSGDVNGDDPTQLTSFGHTVTNLFTGVVNRTDNSQLMLGSGRARISPSRAWY
jgi:hypothetical protein